MARKNNFVSADEVAAFEGMLENAAGKIALDAIDPAPSPRLSKELRDKIGDEVHGLCLLLVREELGEGRFITPELQQRNGNYLLSLLRNPIARVIENHQEALLNTLIEDGESACTEPPPEVDPDTFEFGDEEIIEATDIVLPIHENPFHMLGVSMRDTRSAIQMCCNQQKLQLDPAECDKARGDLTNPRNRLAAELGWLPGCSPEECERLLDAMAKGFAALKKIDVGTALAKANLLEGIIIALPPSTPREQWVEIIIEFGEVFDEIYADELFQTINDDRRVAGFTAVPSITNIETELQTRQDSYISALKQSLDRLSPKTLVAVVTEVVEASSSQGTTAAPLLIDILVDAYALEVDGFLEQESLNILKLLKEVECNAERGEGYVLKKISSLEQVLKNWDAVAQPIQMNYQSRGLDHEQSKSLAQDLRSVGVALFNEHNMLEASLKITCILQEVFAELPHFVRQLDEDAIALEEIQQGREENLRKNKEWAREMTYEASWGLFLKDRISIDPDFFTYNSAVIPVDSIFALRWGGVAHYRNGIHSHTQYNIFVRSYNGKVIVSLKSAEIYGNITQRLFRLTLNQVIESILSPLSEGGTYSLGDTTIYDDGIVLNKAEQFRRSDTRKFRWQEIEYSSQKGSLYIDARSDKQFCTILSYSHVDNVHFLELILDVFFKGKHKVLSDIMS